MESAVLNKWLARKDTIVQCNRIYSDTTKLNTFLYHQVIDTIVDPEQVGLRRRHLHST